MKIFRLELSLEEGVSPLRQRKKGNWEEWAAEANVWESMCFGGTTCISELPGCGMLWWETTVRKAEEGAEYGGPGVLLIRSLDSILRALRSQTLNSSCKKATWSGLKLTKITLATWRMLWWSRPGGRGMNYKVISLVWIRDGKSLN